MRAKKAEVAVATKPAARKPIEDDKNMLVLFVGRLMVSIHSLFLLFLLSFSKSIRLHHAVFGNIYKKSPE
jgi:hypothetical protein